MISKESHPIQQRRAIRCTVLGRTKAPFRLRRMNAVSYIRGIKISSEMLVVWHTRKQPVYGTRYDRSTWSANRQITRHEGAPWKKQGPVQTVCVCVWMWESEPLQGTFMMNDLFIWNCCAKIHYVHSRLSSSVLSSFKVLVQKSSPFLLVWNHILCSPYFYYPLFDLMLCYPSCSFAFLFRLVHFNHNYNIWAVKCKLTRLLKLLFLIKNTQ